MTVSMAGPLSSGHSDPTGTWDIGICVAVADIRVSTCNSRPRRRIPDVNQALPVSSGLAGHGSYRQTFAATHHRFDLPSEQPKTEKHQYGCRFHRIPPMALFESLALIRLCANWSGSKPFCPMDPSVGSVTIVADGRFPRH